MTLHKFIWTLGMLQSTGCLSIHAWPQLSESVSWDLRRTLMEYKMYAAVNLGRVDVPPHTVTVNVSVAVERSHDSCPVKDVNVYANMDGIPFVSRDGEEFPNNTYTDASTVYNTTVPSNNKTINWVVEGAPSGSLFLMAVMPKPDSRIKQQGLGRSCRYYLTTRAKVIFFKEGDIDQLHVGKTKLLISDDKKQQIFSFQVPLDTVQYELEITSCNKTACPVNISVWESLGPFLHDSQPVSCVWVTGSCSIKIVNPAVQSANYLVVSAEKDVKANLDINLTISQCKQRLKPNMTLLFEPPSGYLKGVTDIEESQCILAGQLGRETPTSAPEGSSFFDHFVKWDRQMSPHTVITEKVSDPEYLVHRFNLRTTDTGSSLRVDVRVPPIEDLNEKEDMANSSDVRVDLCLSPRKLFSPRSCGKGKLIQVALKEGSQSKRHVIVPYPVGGVWYISLQSLCYHQEGNTSEEIPVPCTKQVVTNITVHLSPCIDGGCGQYGSCNLYLGGGILYSACDCFAGRRGYGCNDGSQAESENIEKLAVYLLTLSNLAFLPGIFLALHRRFYIEAFAYTYNMFFSTFYHACDTSRIYQLCILEYNTLSFADFFASLMSFWVTLMAMARLPAYPRALLHVGGAVFIALGEVHNRHGLIEQMLPLVVGLAVLFLSWGREICKRRKLFPSRCRLLKFILPGVSLAVLGLVLNLAFETQQNYKYVHSCWHVLEATAICFLLPPYNSSSPKSKRGALSIQSGDICQRPLVGNGVDENAASFQITFQRADETDRTGNSLPGSSPENTGSVPQNGFRLHNRSNRRQNQNFIL